jgi:hypothetical protein
MCFGATGNGRIDLAPRPEKILFEATGGLLPTAANDGYDQGHQLKRATSRLAEALTTKPRPEAGRYGLHRQRLAGRGERATYAGRRQSDSGDGARRQVVW